MLSLVPMCSGERKMCYLWYLCVQVRGRCVISDTCVQVIGPVLVQVDAPVFTGHIAVSVQEHVGTKYLVGRWDKTDFSATDLQNGLIYSYGYAVGKYFLVKMRYLLFFCEYPYCHLMTGVTIYN